MATVSIRELTNHASKIIKDVHDTGAYVVVTKHGRPVACLVAVDDMELEDFVLTHAPEFTKGRALADTELAAGETRSLDVVLAELDAAG